jgi:acyl-CoA synthetase (AMP-forming)/AMP-acid ligase II
VYIATRSFLLQAASIVEAYRLPEGCGLVASLPLSSHFGFGHGLILPTVLQSPIGLVEQFDHRSVLTLFMSGQYHYWAGTPLMADMLARAPFPEPRPSAPRVCHISAGRLSETVFRAFLKRFEVALRPSYGRTENGFITAETSPPFEVRPETVGRAAPGTQIRVGDDPHDPYPPGKMGRVWFTSAWYMEGYGFPPHLEPRDGRNGWWPTEDVGVLDQAGCLTLVGRLDECFKTSSGHLVNPAEVARVLTSHPGVRDAVVVPLPGGSGPVIGALVEADEAIEAGELRASAARELPSWLQPRILLVTAEIPRLPNGKVDRQTCVTILATASGAAAA